MYFDLHYYFKVIAFVYAEKGFKGRSRILFRLLVLVPLNYLFNAVFFLLDYVFFPKLWSQKVEKPVFIVGHARSGTTLMHRLMAADGDRFSFFLYWEMFFPSLLQKKILKGLGWIDQHWFGSWINGKLKVWDEKTFAPWRHIHEQGLWIPEEDQFVMRGAFVTQQWSLDLPLIHKVDIFHVDQLSEKRKRRWMRHYKECVKRQLLLHGGHKTHLSKNPVMSGWVNALLETFPDAGIVVMMRDPLQCIPSTLKLMELTWQGNGWSKSQYQPSLDALANISFDTFRLPKIALQENGCERSAIVDYRLLTSAPRAEVKAIYTALNLEMSETFEAHLEAIESKEKKHSSHFEYNFDDYNISREKLELELAEFYQEYQWPRQSDQQEQTQ
ncbi:MAG: sulfotransferase [Pseudomonadales bacterium]